MLVIAFYEWSCFFFLCCGWSSVSHCFVSEALLFLAASYVSKVGWLVVWLEIFFCAVVLLW